MLSVYLQLCQNRGELLSWLSQDDHVWKKERGVSMSPDLEEVPNLPLHRMFLTPDDEASVFTMNNFPLWYRQASEQPAGSFVFNLRWAEGPGNPHPCALEPRPGWGCSSSAAPLVENGNELWDTKPKSPGFPSYLPS